MHPKDISIHDYSYLLPDERIAKYPLPKRDQSKLLVYKAGHIHTSIFNEIAGELPDDSLLFFNETKVIRARLLFQKPTGGVIEIFLLEPFGQDMSTALAATKTVSWRALVGGAGKWKHGVTLELKQDDLTLQASISDRNSENFIVTLSWNGTHHFAEVLEKLGHVPLPPYLHRSDEPADKDRYQSLLAREEGSVAAPTASLHFSEKALANLADKKIEIERLTLHVGAGTFRPVKTETMAGHNMHGEWMEVAVETIDALSDQLLNKKIVAVGTTALRTLESLYWMGCKVAADPSIKSDDISIAQWEMYEPRYPELGAAEALKALSAWLIKNERSHLAARTEILIAPGYTFKIITGLITNFHQPQSTLLLLVAALIGEDWKKVYDYALENDFRFLSYGDGSLLWR